jgi:hypothetical protein
MLKPGASSRSVSRRLEVRIAAEPSRHDAASIATASASELLEVRHLPEYRIAFAEARIADHIVDFFARPDERLKLGNRRTQ